MSLLLSAVLGLAKLAPAVQILQGARSADRLFSGSSDDVAITFRESQKVKVYASNGTLRRTLTFEPGERVLGISDDGRLALEPVDRLFLRGPNRKTSLDGLTTLSRPLGFYGSTLLSSAGPNRGLVVPRSGAPWNIEAPKGRMIGSIDYNPSIATFVGLLSQVNGKHIEVFVAEKNKQFVASFAGLHGNDVASSIALLDDRRIAILVDARAISTRKLRQIPLVPLGSRSLQEYVLTTLDLKSHLVKPCYRLYGSGRFLGQQLARVGHKGLMAAVVGANNDVVMLNLGDRRQFPVNSLP